ncbi:hypothetical protein CARUB_v10026809mg [Capsella rubella]|uniref:Uncharacterized protein n=2 Tax=Capsella rubella TaxID=81985 RepID=R0EXT8_9BRAS|nr:hypothetical protein CARUB_v10026809mg [Capsella rubella]
METPSSTRRVTRSQTRAATNHLLSSKKPEESDKSQSKSVQRNGGKSHQDCRSALFDITNDSPIVGLAMQTPSSGKRNMSRIKSTPGSGEALLRGQVKTLLQKVEEDADLTKISMESRPFIHLVTSPMGLLAPTPANTPQVLDFSVDNDVQIVITSPVVAGQFRTPSHQVVVGSNMFDEKEESLELERSQSITRSLLLDFSDKSEGWESSDCSSVVTQNPEDDNSSVWSMQVNASTKDEDEDEEAYSYYDEEEEDVLCEGMRKMRVDTEFAGKHTRFVYDSEDEDIVEGKEQSPGVLAGKHVRFAADEAMSTSSSF